MHVSGSQRALRSSSPMRLGSAASCIGTATSSATCPRPKCGRSRPCSAIHASEDIVAAREKAVRVVEKLAALRLTRAAELVGAAVEETLTYYAFPEEHWRRIRTNNPLERILREIRRRTRVVGAFPDGQSALNLAAVRSSLSAVMTRRCGIVRASLEVSHDPTAGALFRSLLRWRSRPRCRHVRPRRGLRDLREHALRLRQDGLPSDRE